MDKKVAGAVAGLLLLIAATIIYVYLGYLGLGHRGYMDDTVPWFHRHVVSYLMKGGDIHSDRWLWLTAGRDLARSPVYMDSLLAALGFSDIGYATMAMAALYIMVVYAAAYMIFHDHVASGLASILVSSVPAFLYWFKFTMYGSYIVQPVAFIATILLSIGLMRRSAALYCTGAFIAGILWLLWGSAWIIGVVYALYLAVLIYSGRVETGHLAAGGMLMASSLLGIGLGGFAMTTYHHVFSWLLLGLALIMAILEYKEFIATHDHLKKNMWRLVGVLAIVALAVPITMLYARLFAAPGLPEHYLKPYEPLRDYMSLVILSPFTLLLMLRSNYLGEPWRNPLPAMLVLGFITGVFAAFIDPSLSVYAAASIVVFTSYALYRVLVLAFHAPGATWLRLLYSAFTLWVIVGSVTANAYIPYHVADEAPAIYYSGIPGGVETTLVNKSSFLELLNIIRNTSGEAVVISYWDYSYWLVELGNAHTLADDTGPDEGRRLIAQIFLSNEYTAWGLINRTIKAVHPNATVYILIAETLSLGRSFLGSASAYIGRPITMPSASPDQPPDVRFMPLGDIARLPLYIEYANYDSHTYLDPGKADYIFEYPLAWNNLAWSETRHGGMDYTPLIIRMLSGAVSHEGYKLSNKILELHGVSSLQITGPQYFKLVYVGFTPLYHVEAGVFEYTVVQAYILYKI